jgi:hypothetical protein
MIMQLATAWDGVALRVCDDGRLFEDERLCQRAAADFVTVEPTDTPMKVARMVAEARAAERYWVQFTDRRGIVEPQAPAWRTVAT